MDQTGQDSSTRQTTLPAPSKDESKDGARLGRLKLAAERTRLLFGCYRKGDANDPEIYTAAVAAVLAEYDPEVIVRVTDPRTGLPRQTKFLPNPAEVAEACDKAKVTIKAEKVLTDRGWNWNGEKWVGPNG